MVGHRGTTYVGGRSSKEGVGGWSVLYYKLVLAPCRQGRVGWWIRSCYEVENFIWGERGEIQQGGQGNTLAGFRRCIIKGMEGQAIG